jgi:flagellar biosynthetic protein FliR
MPPLDLTPWLLVFARVSAVLAVFPIFSMANIPVRVRIGLGALTAFLVTPLLPALGAPPASLFGWIGLLAMEVGVGLLLGFICRLIFYILEFAGSVAAMEMGLNLAASFNPFSSGRSEAPGLVLYNLGAVIFLSMDMHHWLLAALQRTYRLLPIGAAQLREALLVDVVGRTSHLFVLGLLMVAPVMAVVFLVNLVFAVLGRAVPQMNVFGESLAFRILGGLAVFGLMLNLVGQHTVNYLRRLPEDFLRVAQLLGGGG